MTDQNPSDRRESLHDLVDWNALRRLFPVLSTGAYLDTATSGPMSANAIQAASRYMKLSAGYGSRAISLWEADIEHARYSIADLIGAEPGQIGFVHNTSMGMVCASLLLEGFGSVVVGQDEHPAVVMPWLARGFDITVVRPGKDRRLVVEDYARAMRPDIRVIAASHVRYNDGHAFDLGELSAVARAHDAFLVVDATQSAGVVPIDARRDTDILVFAGFKWLNAGYGNGVIFSQPKLLEEFGLPIAGRRSRQTQVLKSVEEYDPLLLPRALELGHVAVPNVLALGAAANLVKQVDAAAIQARVRRLTDQLREGLAVLGLRTGADGEHMPPSAIVAIAVEDPDAALQALHRHNVYAAVRGGRIRIAVSWYNNARDIERCLEALAELA